MARDSFLFGLLMFGCSIHALMATSDDDQLDYMNKEEREALKDEARDMFYHAYNAYMVNETMFNTLTDTSVTRDRRLFCQWGHEGHL